MTNPLFARIRQVARNGDSARAWQMFKSAGLGEEDSPEALALKGRLLKDRALRLEGEARLAMAREASETYRRCAGTRRATYPLINAATIAYLCGDREQAREDARCILDIIASGDYEPETRYWLHATVAEARLLLGDKQGCREALLSAVEAAPQAWEDRAATIRQLREILQVSGESFALLEGLSPPPSLHFSGIMDLAGEQEQVREELDALFERLRPGAAFGALAAGTDVLVAEMALERGVQLHVVLPGTLEQFREISVEPYGASWSERFDRLVEGAQSFVELSEQGTLTQVGVAQANEIAMGLAIRRSKQLATDAVAVHVGRVSDMTAHGLANWHVLGLATCEIRRDWPRRSEVAALPEGHMHAVLASMQPFPALRGLTQKPFRSEDGYWLLAFATPLEAVHVAMRVLSSAPRSRLGVDCALSVDDTPPASLAERAVNFARAAQEGEICAPWPHVVRLDLLDPSIRFEEAGELVTPFGDLPFACFRGMSRG